MLTISFHARSIDLLSSSPLVSRLRAVHRSVTSVFVFPASERAGGNGKDSGREGVARYDASAHTYVRSGAALSVETPRRAVGARGSRLVSASVRSHKGVRVRGAAPGVAAGHPIPVNCFLREMRIILRCSD